MPKQHYIEIRDYGRSSGIFIVEIEPKMIIMKGTTALVISKKPVFIHNPATLDVFDPGERIMVERSKIYKDVSGDVKQHLLKHIFKYVFHMN